MKAKQITDDLDKLLGILPLAVQDALAEITNKEELLEIEDKLMKKEK